ncbi:MAG: PIN domain-containing protein [Candidatus Helarchaeota archaeon]
MKLVIDATIIIASLISEESINRELIIKSAHIYLSPGYLKEELKKNYDVLIQASKLPPLKIKQLFEIYFKFIRIFPKKIYSAQLKKAKEIIGHIDEKDVPYIALALTIKDCDGIWTNDKHFKKQKEIRIFNTKELLKIKF